MNNCRNSEQHHVIRSEHVLILKGSIADFIGTNKSIDWRSRWLQWIPYGSTNAFNVNLSTGNVNNNNRTNTNNAICW